MRLLRELQIPVRAIKKKQVWAAWDLAPNVRHSFTPFQGCTGCGAFHLKIPMGGAANGIPL